MSNNNGPTPGSAEYDALMAAKYRNQGKADSLGAEDTGESIERREIVKHGSPDPYNGGNRMGLSVRPGSTLGPAHQPLKATAAMADEGQVHDLRRDIDQLYAELREISHHDRRTGEPVYRISGSARELRERRLVMLESELPLVEQAVAAAKAQRTEQTESTLEKLSREKARQDMVKDRAEELLMEREAEEQAGRLAAEVKTRG